MTLNHVADERYMTAAEAANALNVSLQTLYVYVGRKGIRSQPIPGTKSKRYWRADIERLRRGRGAALGSAEMKEESELTFITETDLFYRGRSATQLAETATFEEVAALLWNADPERAFPTERPIAHPLLGPLDALLRGQPDVDRAASLFPVLEEADPRAYDLSAAGMARTGGDVLRWLAALSVRASEPSSEPIHLFVARHLGCTAEEADLIRRMLVLWADHGFEPGAYAVRAVASAGVTPWRAVITGISVANGRRNRLGRIEAIQRLLREIEEEPKPEAPILQRLRDGEIVPGFDPPLYREGEPIYRNGDPRARALLRCCDQIYGDDLQYLRLKVALALMSELKALEPSNLLVSQFIFRRFGVNPRGTLFHLSRAAGWIGHAIEQHQAGEMEHGRGVYIGPLPA